MQLYPSRIFFLAFLVSMLLTACGGKGDSAPPPAGGLSVVPGNGRVTISWAQDPSTEYWLMYAATASPINISNSPSNHLWVTKISSPYVMTGLTNGTAYSFAMNARTSGGPGGAQTASVNVAPRPAGTSGLWTSGKSFANEMRGLTYDGANYVSVGAKGAIAKSTDGINWTTVTSASTSTNDLNAVIYANTTVGYVVTDTANKIYYGTDLATLNQASTATTKVNGLATDGTNLVAVGDSGTILLSTNGANWTRASTVPTAVNLRAVVYSSGIWVAVGDSGAILVSKDSGITWTVPGAGYATVAVSLRGVAGYGTAFVAVGDNGTVVATTDAATWASQTLAGGATLYAVNTSSIQTIAVGANGTAFVSTDRLAWNAQSTSTGANLLALAGSPTQYVVVGANGVNAMSQ